MPPNSEWEEINIWEGNVTVWHAWEQECDACGRAESSLKPPAKDQLLSCSGCLVAKYCSKRDWGEGHKNHCHLYEANRKLSSVFAKSLGPGTINDPTLSLSDKVVQWNFLNVANHLVIAAAALKNDPKFAGTVNIAILLSLAGDRAGSKYEHRTFFIDRVLLLGRDVSNAAARGHHFKLLVGWCSLPKDELSKTQMWIFPASDAANHVLPPGFDLNRYVTHRHHHLLSGLKGGQGIIGVINADGTRKPVYKFNGGGHFRRCAPGETDSDGPAEFKKPLMDSSRMVGLISLHLESYEHAPREIPNRHLKT
ncbi:hypothetical protein B0H11DRAFT_2079659 [Mycena galericulata]|nr:hypothetical protein B0H11DRAFT_2079659 [Mycena galericulata]